MERDFLPISREDLLQRGWYYYDFLLITGDAYVDHPSFGTAIISRVLEHAGYKVGILSQPDWRDPDSITALGEPRLGFLVTGGNMDSMVNHYTVSHHHRKTDAFTPAVSAESARITQRSSTVTSSASATGIRPSSSAALRQVSAAWGITTTGPTRSSAPFCSTVRQICCSTAWASAASSPWQMR